MSKKVSSGLPTKDQDELHDRAGKELNKYLTRNIGRHPDYPADPLPSTFYEFARMRAREEQMSNKSNPADSKMSTSTLKQHSSREHAQNALDFPFHNRHRPELTTFPPIEPQSAIQESSKQQRKKGTGEERINQPGMQDAARDQCTRSKRIEDEAFTQRVGVPNPGSSERLEPRTPCACCQQLICTCGRVLRCLSPRNWRERRSGREEGSEPSPETGSLRGGGQLPGKIRRKLAEKRAKGRTKRQNPKLVLSPGFHPFRPLSTESIEVLPIDSHWPVPSSATNSVSQAKTKPFDPFENRRLSSGSSRPDSKYTPSFSSSIIVEPHDTPPPVQENDSPWDYRKKHKYRDLHPIQPPPELYLPTDHGYTRPAALPMPGSYPPSRPDSPSSVSAHTRDHDDAHLGSSTNAAKEPQEAESSEPKFATPKLRGGGDDEMHARVPANLWYLAGGSGAPPTYKNYRGKRKSARKKGQDRAKEGYWKDVIHWGLPREKKRRPEGGDGNGEVQPAPMDRPPSQNPDPEPAQPPQQPQEEPPLEQPPHQEPLPQEPPPQEPPPQEQPPQEQPPQDDPPHDPPADPFADPPADPDPPRDPPDDDVAPRRGIPRDQIMELYGEMLTDFFNNVDRVARQILDDLDARRMIDGDDREEKRRRRTW